MKANDRIARGATAGGQDTARCSRKSMWEPGHGRGHTSTFANGLREFRPYLYGGKVSIRGALKRVFASLTIDHLTEWARSGLFWARGLSGVVYRLF